MARLQMIMSPAKTLNFEACAEADLAGRTVCAGLDRANKLAAVLKGMPRAELKAVLGVSDALVAENYDRFQRWDEAPELQCVVAYDGMAYAKLKARDLAAADLEWANGHLVILSGMWGGLRALDAIKPYRLEMATKRLARPYDKLARFWTDEATDTILKGYDGNADGCVLVNLASDEYAAAVDFGAVAAAGVRVVKVDFHQGGRRAAAIHLKHGRGLVARYAILHRCDNLDSLRAFDLEGYALDEAKSDGNNLVFARATAPAKAPPAPSDKKRKKAAS